MANDDFKLNLEIDANFDGESEVKKAENEVDALAESLEKASKTAEQGNESFQQYKARMNELGAATKQMHSSMSGSEDYQRRYNAELEKTGQLLNKSTYQELVDEVGRLTAAQRRHAEALDETKLALQEVEKIERGTSYASEDDKVAAQQRYNAALREQVGTWREVSAATREYEGDLIRARYALESVSRHAAVMGAALLGSFVGGAKVFADWQVGLANVERTVLDGSRGMVGYDQKVQDLNASLKEIAVTAPIAFEDLARTGQLAGQLGIAESRVADFTKTVEMFAATTGVSAEASATAFARLDALVKDVQGNYEGLASSILQVGVNSIATENEIISITTQIAAMASAVGFAGHEIIGLSSTLASVRVPPELSRGMVSRVFGNIQSAVSQGGMALENFARVAGYTADEFQRNWNENAADTFVSLLQGINSEGANARDAIRDLGIQAERDVGALLRLSQNIDLLHKDMANAAQGFESETVFMEHYEVVAGTLSARLTILSNSFQSLLHTIFEAEGAGAFLGMLVDGLSRTVNMIERLLASPVGGWFAMAGAAVVGLSGAVLLSVAAIARMRSGLSSLITSVVSYTQATKSAGATTGGTIAAFRAQAIAAGLSERAVNRLTVAFRAMRAATIIGGATMLVSWIYNMVAGADEATESLTQLAGTFEIIDGKAQGTASSFQAIASSMTESGIFEALQSMGIEIDGIIEQITTEGTEAEVFKQLEAQIASTQSELERLRGEWEQTRDLKLRDEIAAQTDTLNEQEALLDQLTGIYREYNAEAREAEEQARATGEGFADSAEDIQEATQQLQEFLGIQDELNAADVGGALATLAQNLEQYGDVWDAFTEGGAANLKALDSLITAVVQNANGNHGQIVADVQAIMQAMTDSGMQTAGTFEYLSRVLAQYAAQGQATAGVFNRAFAGVGASGILGAFSGLQAVRKEQEKFTQASFTAAQATNALNRGIDAGTAARNKNTGASRRNTGAKDANRKAADANKAAIDRLNEAIKAQDDILNRNVRTTSDFASDVSGIWQNAFDLNTGPALQLIKIADGWDDIAQAANDAKQAMRDANAIIADLTSTRDILEYQLTVAEMYGDELRAGQIRAELAKNTADMAKAEQDLADAKKANKDAAGTPELYDMVGQYGDLIDMYLRAGYQGAGLQKVIDNLAKDFRKQAKDAGFNTTQIDNMAKMLREFGNIAKSVPDPDVNFRVSYGNHGYVTATQIGRTVANEIQNWAIPNREFLLSMGWRPPTGTSRDFIQFWNQQVTAFNKRSRLQAELNLRQTKQKGFDAAVRQFNSVPSGKTATLSFRADTSQLKARYLALAASSLPLPGGLALYKAYMQAASRLASGGAVGGRGTGTSDSVPAFLSKGEHVMTAREVRMLGGQSGAYALREAIRSGNLRKLAQGGEVGNDARDGIVIPVTSRVQTQAVSSGINGPIELGPVSLDAIVNRAIQVIIDSSELTNVQAKGNHNRSVLSGVG